MLPHKCAFKFCSHVIYVIFAVVTKIKLSVWSVIIHCCWYWWYIYMYMYVSAPFSQVHPFETGAFLVKLITLHYTEVGTLPLSSYMYLLIYHYGSQGPYLSWNLLISLNFNFCSSRPRNLEKGHIFYIDLDKSENNLENILSCWICLINIFKNFKLTFYH